VTNHKVYGEDIAILAMAYWLTPLSLLLDTTRNVPAERLLQVITRLGRAVGQVGGGQVVDLDQRKARCFYRPNFIHNKTAALLEASVVCGGILQGHQKWICNDCLATLKIWAGVSNCR